jgi:hypothetical protein
MISRRRRRRRDKKKSYIAAREQGGQSIHLNIFLYSSLSRNPKSMDRHEYVMTKELNRPNVKAKYR